ncbi:hypothetical protein BJ322DRAFT_668726 [Thelephora terrestris]|uniref:Uncharacterized protein n=1 Tax=Thelephora terrestris TaxID=56493 RepID=A0A9P6L8G0_9AGAM|nr:hypothetical protein BJ322DRAFT_668726 [Thelephora terrestris]
MPPKEKDYYCHCDRCNGGKAVAKSTFYRHGGRLKRKLSQRTKDRILSLPDTPPPIRRRRTRRRNGRTSTDASLLCNRASGSASGAGSGVGSSQIDGMPTEIHPNSLPQSTIDQEADLRFPPPPSIEASDFDNRDPHPPNLLDVVGEENLSLDQTFNNLDTGNRTSHNSEDEALPENLLPVIEDPIVFQKIVESLRFIEMPENATLKSQLTLEDLDTPRNPAPQSSTSLDDPDLLLSISCFIDLLSSPQDTYENIRRNIRRLWPSVEMLSYHQVKCVVQDLWDRHAEGRYVTQSSHGTGEGGGD